MSAENSASDPEVSTEIDESEIKHPLQSSWTMHISMQASKKSQSGSGWPSQVKELYTFASVEDFWRLWNNIVTPSELSPGTDYFLFREGIQPAWEDPQNAKGGSFVLRLKPLTAASDKDEKARIDKYWLWTVLALIGESIPDSECITGVSFSLRKYGIKICVWTKDAEAKDINIGIGKKFIEVLSLPPHVKIPFEAHGSSNKTLYSV